MNSVAINNLVIQDQSLPHAEPRFIANNIDIENLSFQHFI